MAIAGRNRQIIKEYNIRFFNMGTNVMLNTLNGKAGKLVWERFI